MASNRHVQDLLKKANVDVTVQDVELTTSSSSAASSQSGGPTIEVGDGNLESKQSIDAECGYPEGGLQAWLVVFGSWCAQFLVFGLVNSTAVFQDYVSTHQLQDKTASEVGICFSLPLFLTFFLGLYVGPIFDAHGPRLLVAFGSVAIVASTFLFSISTEYWHFMLAYSVLSGVGGALLSIPSFASIGHFFQRRQGLATGISTTGGSIGGIVMPIAMSVLLPRIGWEWTIRVVGFMLLALLVPANVFIRARLPPTRRRIQVIPDMSALRNSSFALCVVGIFLMEWGIFVPDAYISSYITAHDGRQGLGFTTLAAMNAAGIPGRIIPGYMADRFGVCTTLVVTILLCSTAVLGLWLPAGSHTGPIVAFATLFGFSSGSNLGLIPVYLLQVGASLEKECSEGSAGISAAYFLSSFGTLSSIPLAGAILEKAGGQYWGAIFFSGASYAVAGGCFAVARILAVGWDLRLAF